LSVVPLVVVGVVALLGVVVRVFVGVSREAFAVAGLVVVQTNVVLYTPIWVNLSCHFACYQPMKNIGAVRAKSERFAFIW
jgi:hypothetical protein